MLLLNVLHKLFVITDEIRCKFGKFTSQLKVETKNKYINKKHKKQGNKQNNYGCNIM